MRILDRYLVNRFAQSLFYCLGLFTVLFVVIDVFGNLERDLQTVVRVRPGLFLLAYPQGDPLDLEGDRVQHQLVVEWALTFDVECGSAGHAFSLQVQRQIER